MNVQRANGAYEIIFHEFTWDVKSRERPSGLTSVITDIVAAVVTAVVFRGSEVQLRLSAFIRNATFVRRRHYGREISFRP